MDTVNQDSRYDNKVRAALQAVSDSAEGDEGDETVTVSRAALAELERVASRELMPGDILAYAHQYPRKMMKGAKRLMGDKAWMARAQGK